MKDLKLADRLKIVSTTSPPVKQTAKSTITCDCTGGPGRNNAPGTGLIDDFTLCPKCQGSGKVAS